MKVVVCGAGQVGTTIARHLASEGISVTVIDIDEEQVRRVDESYDVRGVTGHASHPAVLRKADAQDADMLIAVTRSDEVNMVACQVAYALFGVKRRIARLRHSGYFDHESAELYVSKHLPIDIIISPEIEIADGIAWRLRAPGAFDMVPMAKGRVELLGIHTEGVDGPIIGKRISDVVQDPNFDDVAIVALARKGRCFIPNEQDRIEAGDDVYVIAKTEKVKGLMQAFGHREREAKKLIIVGAGNIGLHLAQKILHDSPRVDIKIIEQNQGRARYISNTLGSRVIVLQGDVLDPELLEEAQASTAETIVAVTNDDETNIFASVLAKQAGCKRAITLINKRNYEAFTPLLGIDAVVSPSAATISTVLRHVRRGTIAALHTLREDFGEIVEAEVTDNSTLCRRTLGELRLSAGIKIGVVVRDGEVIIPTPQTQLQTGDHIVALVTYKHLHYFESLLGARR